MIDILTADHISIDKITSMAGPKGAQQGRALHGQGKALVRRVELDEAEVEVDDERNLTFRVTFRASGTLAYPSCTCREAYRGSCMHIVAAALTLRQHLYHNPPELWRAVLGQSIKRPSRRAAIGSALVFSLQNRGSGWAVAPYSLAGRYFPIDHLGDPDSIAAVVEEIDAALHAKPLNSLRSESFPRMPIEALSAARIVATGGSFGYWYGGASALSDVLRLLPHCAVFLGEPHDPFQQRVLVLAEPANVELDVSRKAGAVKIGGTLVAGERRLTFRRGQARLISAEPPWLMIDDIVARLEELNPTIEALIAYAELQVPAAREDELIEQYLVPLSERLPVRGDVLQFAELNEPPQPRLYLSERDGAVTAELRFAYGPHELPHEKSTPLTTMRRRPGGPVERIRRDPEAEQAAAAALAAHSLKRGDAPAEFKLRRGTHLLDFLLRDLPRIAESGLSVFGEEALTSAKVNRARPKISFSVSSGIDWFDLQAVVEYGDQTVSLRDLRRAVRKREKYIKLADGSIGLIPEEWERRFRQLFGLAEEAEAGLRLRASQVALLDEAISGDDLRADQTFRDRLARLRSVDRIPPRALPRGLRAELRPYQHAGYDWLRFLHDADLGGILADDMGTGKCLVGTSRVFVNGTLVRAADLWERYAGPTLHDGAGEWAEPAAPLIVNAIDEASGRVVRAEVRRLYRQRVRERLRTVRLEDGSEVTITRRHRLLGRDGWTNQLAPGDYVCVPARLEWPGEPVDPDLITLLAWQIAEGHELTARATVTISQNDTSRLAELRETLIRVAARYALKINAPRVSAFREKTPTLRIDSVAYRRFLEQRGYSWGHRSAQKSIPDFIMRADADGVRLFLRHLFDAEGSMMRAGRGIEISSASEQLITQVSVLLRRLGIWMRVHARQKCATNGRRIMRTYYSGLISGNGARRFLEEIGFGDAHKQGRLRELCALPCNTNIEGVPPSDIVGRVVAATGLPVRHFGMHNTVYINGTQQFSRASIGRVIGSTDAILSGEAERAHRELPRSKWTARPTAAYERLDRPMLQAERRRLAHLASQDAHYCRVESVEEVEHDGWVYDLEVAKHHNFVAEGVLCHNTVQTLALLQALREEEPERPADLIVMPRSLLFNWQSEAARFTPELRVYVHADQGRISEPEEFGRHHLVLTTYGVMLRDIALLRQYHFGYAILDESQAIKNPVAETSRAARALQSEHRLVLTGTPVENSAIELWSQLAFANPGLLGSLEGFRNEYVTQIERHQSDEAAAALRRLVHPFILRRTKDQVAQDLPPRTEELLYVELEPAQRKLYAKTREFYRATLLGMIDDSGMDDARLKVLEGLLRLRQICDHPRLVDEKHRGGSAKLELLVDTLETLRAEGHKALVFSQFVQMLTLVREALDARGLSYAYLDGSTRDRQAVVEQFQAEGGPPVFLISLKAGGVGLNLTAADYVIHVDPWWNPAVELQATDRTHRIGQTRPVFVYKLITRDTVEEKILGLQERKRALVEQLIAADAGMVKSLTREDVADLFS